MNRILILYPNEFTCQSKFDRKLLKITSNLDDYTFVCLSENNPLVECHVNSLHQTGNVEWVKNLDDANPTHAVIFDDGDSYNDVIGDLVSASIPVRRIKVLITRVVNIKRAPEYKLTSDSPEYQYIGRGSYWGNPYSIGQDGDRDEVVRKFSYDFEFDKFPNKSKNEVHKLRGKTLGCFCKPDKCHGDILADYLNSYDDGE